MRNQIECDFGRLKATWRVLTKTVDLKLEIVPVAFYRCFVLHNFGELKNYSGLDEEEVEAQTMRHRLEKQNNINLPDPIQSNNTSERKYIESILTNYIQEYLPDGYLILLKSFCHALNI